MTQLRSRSTPDSGSGTGAEIISLPEWARRIDISKESAYKAVRRGEVLGAFTVGRLGAWCLSRG